MPLRIISLKIEDDLLAAIDALAREQNLPRSVVIKKLLRCALEHEAEKRLAQTRRIRIIK